MKLYGVMRSRATRPWWALTESGLPFEQVPVIQSNRLADAKAADAPLNTASPSFLAINPMGQVPALVDGDVVLTESQAIILYVARKAGAPFGPRDQAEDAAFQNWAFFAASALEPGALDILYPVMAGQKDTAEGQARMQRGAEALVRPLARLQAHLAGREWVMGDRFTAADICLAEVVRYAQAHPPALAAFPAVREWMARCQARSAFQAMMAARNAEPA